MSATEKERDREGSEREKRGRERFKETDIRLT